MEYQWTMFHMFSVILHFSFFSTFLINFPKVFCFSKRGLINFVSKWHDICLVKWFVRILINFLRCYEQWWKNLKVDELIVFKNLNESYNFLLPLISFLFVKMFDLHKKKQSSLNCLLSFYYWSLVKGCYPFFSRIC